MQSNEEKSSRRQSKTEKNNRKMRMEKIAVYVAFCAGLLATFLFLIAVCSDHWVTVQLSNSQFRNDTGRGGPFYKTGHYHGLWRICRKEYVNDTDNEPYNRLYCRTMYYFSQPPDVRFGVYDNEILLYRRSSAAISLLGLLLSFIAHGFTWYSFAQLRYMFKRLAATLHLITGACCWVTVEVFKRSMDYEQAHLKVLVPPDSVIEFGWSYALGWLSFILFILVAIALFACSRKRKGSHALSVKEAQENEPVVLGRV